MAYLDSHRPAVQQWYTKRSRALTGCTVLHTAESVMDSVGPDTGAESVADFIARRTTAGSYHDLVDSDSWVQLVDLDHGAFHDGTGSNNWALSISFACRTSDWRAMSAEKRRGFLRQGARAFVAQQAYRRARGFPTTELRLITKAQSDAGMSGFTYHGFRDPGRRSDPGVSSPNLFPIEEFISECRAALAGTTTQEDDEDMDPNIARQIGETYNAVNALVGVADRPIQVETRINAKLDALLGVLQSDDDQIDVDALITKISSGVTERVTASLLASVGDIVRAELGADNADQAELIVAKIGERLR